MMTNRHAQSPTLLGQADPAPVGVRNPGKDSPFFLICDHAGNAVPAVLGNLGLERRDLDRHIGIDIGILGVSEQLSDLLGAPLVFQRYSRLVVECNRRPTSPDFVAAISDGTPVPGNVGISADDRARRASEISEPYHREIVSRLDDRQAAGRPTILVSMHSFTPSLLARPAPRPWHVGLCYDADRRFSMPVLEALGMESGLEIGRNEPYGVNMAADYSIPVHGEERGLPYVEFEIRQDLIAAVDGQAQWAQRIARVLNAAYASYAAGVA